ncbi:hypothetical protein MKZ38_003503 [Zalerion maritima]|uniref:GDP/GTP exchange factor Sec2 N-terminal domain-containing protein n=1 Tax=Zalerion maritima TaxID=339359 RepID=A0AAD5WWM5_9PEZI|nr:hypothetical protein MKZ38_003503 [Zalerion maritima]
MWGRLKNATGWGQGRAVGHIRSLSNLRPSSPQAKPSTTSLRSSYGASTTLDMSAVSAVQPPREELDLSTLPDPRIRNVTPSQGPRPQTPHHPDLSNEVAALSQKLVHAINLQTSLDDTLSETRHDLGLARKRIQDLEGIVASQKATLDGDVWIRRTTVEPEKELLRQRIRDVRREMAASEAETKRMRDELADYSTKVMASAQEMVVRAKTEFQEREDQLNQKVEQLEGQASDYEEMFKAQQEQLIELREEMEKQKKQTAEDVPDQPAEDRSSCGCPSPPGLSRTSGADDEPESSTAADMPASAPVAPLSLTHLLQPALREDVCVFAEFAELVEMAKLPQPASHGRASSGGYSGFSSLAMGLGGNPYALSQENSSSASLPTSATSATTATTATDSNPHTPNTPASSVSVASMASSKPLQHLQSTKFFKRIVDEDIEPTIRRNTSVINWVTKRSFSSACADGTLVIEPVLTDTSIARIIKPQFDPCSICGEDSRERERLRMHKFGVGSEAKNPLCDYCLVRVRTSCELVTFLRMIRDGVWKVEGEDGLRSAWEECTRLREEIFWARIGGGVIPAQDRRHGQPGSRRVSHEATPVPPEPAEPSVEPTAAPLKETSAKPSDESPAKRSNEPFKVAPGEPGVAKPSSAPPVLRQRSESAINARPSAPSKGPQAALKRLSLTIPIGAGFFS